MNSPPCLSFYSRLINEFTGIEDHKDLLRIEEFMRNSIFHSTLDWQTKEQLNEGARKAVIFLRLGAEQGYWKPLNSDLIED
jgi:hypothetical protein